MRKDTLDIILADCEENPDQVIKTSMQQFIPVPAALNNRISRGVETDVTDASIKQSKPVSLVPTALNNRISRGGETDVTNVSVDEVITSDIQSITTGDILKISPNIRSLQQYNVYINDTNINSKYFNISQFPDVLYAGKNFFLIDGTEYLEPGSYISFEILDSSGKVIYSEISSDLINGTSRAITMYVYYGITSIGNASITMLGILKDVPLNWKNTYNVKWTRNITVNTLIGDSRPPILSSTPTAEFVELYNVENLHSVSKIHKKYSVSS